MRSFSSAVSAATSASLTTVLGLATWVAACGSNASSNGFPPGSDAAVGDGATIDGSMTGDGSADTGSPGFGDGGLIQGEGGVTGDAGLVFDVEPSALQVIMVAAGKTSPQVKYAATLGGKPISAGWTVDRGDLGTIGMGPSSSATFSPTGTTGGLVDVIAGLQGQTLKRQVFIELSSSQNGATAGESGQVPTTVAQLGTGGGVGGVGGEGLGGPVDATTAMALQNPMPGSTQALTFLYPYDQTVFPRGLLAPLLQWSWTPGDADAILVTLKTTSGSFSWSGTFAKPAILSQPGVPTPNFIRHPIPQDVWTMATNTAGGATPNGKPDQLVLSLTVAKGGIGYGPITETWSIAPAHLEGTVYYNSYGTQLVQNSTDKDFDGNQYGAAVLGIQEGSTGPTVVAGTNTPGNYSGTGCRVCHVVSGSGSLLIAQHGDVYQETSSYGLKNANAETALAAYDSTFGWAGLTSDGSLALTNTAQMAAGQPSASQLYAFPPAAAGATPLAATGIPADLQAGAPAFSADGKHVAFELLGGTLGTYVGTYTGASQLVVLDFDASTYTFSNPRLLAKAPGGGSQGGGGQNAGLPSFFPTNDAVAYHDQLANPAASHRYNTWHGAQAQVWWSDLATGTATALSELNGLTSGSTTSYLPTSSTHPNDTVLNYEPTVNPVASGGYIWVVFTSRRMYGNVATADPTQSDPRGYDYRNLANTTCKKLWVAAIDLNAKAGTDPSHPAFYLPAQELLAGNARGFWVLPPCLANGQSCQSGDQCCNGYCEPSAGDGGLVCSNTPPNNQCSQPQEKCTTAADCCDPTNVCVDGFCTVSTPQ